MVGGETTNWSQHDGFQIHKDDANGSWNNIFTDFPANSIIRIRFNSTNWARFKIVENLSYYTYSNEWIYKYRTQHIESAGTYSAGNDQCSIDFYTAAQPGLAGAQGADGAEGVDGVGISLIADSQVFTYDVEQANPSPQSATITASLYGQVTSSDVHYTFFVNDSSVQTSTNTSGSATYTYTPQSDGTDMPDKIEVEARYGTTNSGPIIARDMLTVSALLPGADGEAGIQAILSNETHTCGINPLNGEIIYTGSGTDIYAYIGTTKLEYTQTAGIVANRFTVTASGTDIDPDDNPQVDGSDNTRYIFLDADNMDDSTAFIEYTITITKSDLSTEVITKKQTFSQSTSGSDGTDGSVWHHGAGDPASNIGQNGDYYLNTTDDSVHYKSGGTWAEIINSLAGSDGADGAAGDAGTAGADGISFTFWGTYATVAAFLADDPGGDGLQEGDAYYNSGDGKSYVYSGGSWHQMSVDGVNGDAGQNGLPIVWKGDLSSAPSDPVENWAYRNTTTNIIYIYDGSAWDPMVYDGNDGADGTELAWPLDYNTVANDGFGLYDNSDNYITDFSTIVDGDNYKIKIPLTDDNGVNRTSVFTSIGVGYTVRWQNEDGSKYLDYHLGSDSNGWTDIGSSHKEWDTGTVMSHSSDTISNATAGRFSIYQTMQIYITYNDNDADTPPSTPTNIDGTLPSGWHTNPTAASNWMSQKVDNGTTTAWGTPIRIGGEDGQNATNHNWIFIDTDDNPPDTPTASETVPAGWADNAPASIVDKLWTSLGVQALGTGNFVWGDPTPLSGTDGAVGPQGSAGVDGKTIQILTEKVFEYNEGGLSPSPDNLNITALPFGADDPYIEFLVSGVSVQNGTNTLYNYTPEANFDDMPKVIEVNLREGSTTGTILAKDMNLLYGVKQGAHSYTVVLSNPAHTVPCETNGTVSAGGYAGAGTKINVYKGTTKLPHESSGASSYHVNSINDVGITVGSATEPDSWTTQYGNPSSMNLNVATIDFEIGVRNEADEMVYIEIRQTITKSVAGATGATGDPGTTYRTVYAYKSDETVTTPTGGSIDSSGDFTPPVGWSHSPMASTLPDKTWVSQCTFAQTDPNNSFTQHSTAWSTPIQFIGQDGQAGQNGPRGSESFSLARSDNTAQWDNEDAYDLIVSNSSDGEVRQFDTVTFFNNSGVPDAWSLSKYYTGTGTGATSEWDDANLVVDGNTIVHGTIGANQIAADSITANLINSQTIWGNSINIGSDFSVSSSGKLVCTEAEVSGTIKGEDGWFGNIKHWGYRMLWVNSSTLYGNDGEDDYRGNIMLGNTSTGQLMQYVYDGSYNNIVLGDGGLASNVHGNDNIAIGQYAMPNAATDVITDQEVTNARRLNRGNISIGEATAWSLQEGSSNINIGPYLHLGTIHREAIGGGSQPVNFTGWRYKEVSSADNNVTYTYNRPNLTLGYQHGNLNSGIANSVGGIEGGGVDLSEQCGGFSSYYTLTDDASDIAKNRFMTSNDDEVLWNIPFKDEDVSGANPEKWFIRLDSGVMWEALADYDDNYSGFDHGDASWSSVNDTIWNVHHPNGDNIFEPTASINNTSYLGPDVLTFAMLASVNSDVIDNGNGDKLKIQIGYSKAGAAIDEEDDFVLLREFEPWDVPTFPDFDSLGADKFHYIECTVSLHDKMGISSGSSDTHPKISGASDWMGSGKECYTFTVRIFYGELLVESGVNNASAWGYGMHIAQVWFGKGYPSWFEQDRGNSSSNTYNNRAPVIPWKTGYMNKPSRDAGQRHTSPSLGDHSFNVTIGSGGMITNDSNNAGVVDQHAYFRPTNPDFFSWQHPYNKFGTATILGWRYRWNEYNSISSAGRGEPFPVIHYEGPIAGASPDGHVSQDPIGDGDYTNLGQGTTYISGNVSISEPDTSPSHVDQFDGYSGSTDTNNDALLKENNPHYFPRQELRKWGKLSAGSIGLAVEVRTPKVDINEGGTAMFRAQWTKDATGLTDGNWDGPNEGESFLRIDIKGLPDYDPGVEGVLWMTSAGVLKVSDGN